MAISLTRELPSKGSRGYYTDKWLRAILAHKQYLIEHPTTKLVQLTEMITYRYRYDVRAYLLSLNIEPKFHEAIMVINGISDPQNFDSESKTFYVPDPDKLGEIFRLT